MLCILVALCSVGTYFDDVTESCVACAPLTYQDEEGQPSCKPCPTNYNTEMDEILNMGFISGVKGSISVQQCQGKLDHVVAI